MANREHRHTWKVPTSLAFSGSLLLFSLASLVLMALLYRQFRKSLLDTMTKQRQEFARQVSATCAFSDQILIDTANQIYYDETITRLRESYNLSNYDFIEGIRQINAITAYNTLIDSIFLYNGKSGWIYSTAQDGAVNAKVDHFQDREAANLLTKRDARNRFHLIPRINHSLRDNGQLYSYLYFETDNEGNPKDSALLLNLRPASFNRLYFSSPDTFIISREGTFVASSTGREPEDRDWIGAQIQESGENAGYLVEGGEIVFFTLLEEQDWIYVQRLSKRAVFGSLMNVRNLTFLIFGLFVAISLFVFIVFSIRFYLPLKIMTSRISKATGGQREEDDPQKAMEGLSQLIDDRETMRPVVKNRLLDGILHGSKPSTGTLFGSEDYHLSIVIDMPLKLLLVSGCSIDSLTSRIQEIVPAVEGYRVDDQYGFLFLQCNTEGQMQAVRTSIMRHAGYLVMSEEIIDWSQIPLVTARLMELWKLRFLHPERHFIALDDVSPLSHGVSQLSEQTAFTIVCLKKGYYVRAMESLITLIGKMEGKKYSPVRISLLNIGYRILKMASDYGRLDTSYEEASLQYQKKVDTLDDINSLVDYLSVLMKQITEAIQDDQMEDKQQVSVRVKAFVATHYADTELSTKMIADAFHMSPAYLSRLFKHSAHEGVAQYVNRIRIEHSKEYLRQQGIQVKEVPRMVGIANGQYFFHLFKKLTGMTPKEYQRTAFMGRKVSD